MRRLENLNPKQGFFHRNWEPAGTRRKNRRNSLAERPKLTAFVTDLAPAAHGLRASGTNKRRSSSLPHHKYFPRPEQSPVAGLSLHLHCISSSSGILYKASKSVKALEFVKVFCNNLRLCALKRRLRLYQAREDDSHCDVRGSSGAIHGVSDQSRGRHGAAVPVSSARSPVHSERAASGALIDISSAADTMINISSSVDTMRLASVYFSFPFAFFFFFWLSKSVPICELNVKDVF